LLQIVKEYCKWKCLERKTTGNLKRICAQL